MLGATTIIAVDGNEHRLGMSKKMGANITFNFKTCDVVGEVIRLTDGCGADAAIEALGLQATFESALRVLKPGGTVSSLGEYSTDLKILVFGFWYRKRDGTLNRPLFATHMLFWCTQIEALRRQTLWTVIDTPEVEPTNNRAERTLRSYVIWRKVGFGAQSARGSRYLARIMTVVGSCRLQGRNLLGSLTRAIQAHWGAGSLTSLVRFDVVAT